nr:unnamed protein product [Callosobruchus analis]
MSRRSH